MDSTEKNINVKNSKPRKSFLSFFLKAIVIFVLLLLLLIVGLFFFIQTDTFDNLALGLALDKINEELEPKNSKIYAESLEGNLFKGFTLNNGSVIVKDDTLMKFTSIHADYDIWKLLDKEISVQNIHIKDPQINLTKIRDNKDSMVWNLNYLLSKEEEDTDTTTSKFDWKILADDIKIENGSARILENKNSDLPIRKIDMPELDTFQLGKLDITNLNLSAQAKYLPDLKEFQLKSLAFNTNSEFNVNQLSLLANVDEANAVTSVKELNLTTDRSELKIHKLIMQGLNPFDSVVYEEFGRNETSLELEAKHFNFDDLTFFFPNINFLDSAVGLYLAADGNFGNLQISRLDLKTPNSMYNFAGSVMHLNEPSKLYFDINGKDIVADPSDTRILLPGLNIPDYSYLGKVYINRLSYVGEPAKFTTGFDIRSSAGNAMGEMFFDFTQPVSNYRGNVGVGSLNIGKIIKNRELESNISGEFVVNARGFDYRTMSGKLNYSIERTKFYGQNISRSNGQINFNRGNYNLDVNYNSDAVQTKLAGSVNISNLQNITYDLKGSVTNLNIAAFTKDNSQRSKLTFDFDIKGRGYHPDNIAGSYKIRMANSTYADYLIPATPLDLEIDQNGNIRKISLKSDFADLDIDGTFNIKDVSEVVMNNIERIQNGITSKIMPDSAAIFSVESQNFSPLCRNLSFAYSLNVKDLTPLYTFTGNDTLKFSGELSGSLSDSCGLFSLIADGTVRNFVMKDSSFITDTTVFKVDIKNDMNAPGLTKFDADLDLYADKMIISKNRFDSTIVNISYHDSANSIFVETKRDSTLRLFAKAGLKDSALITFDTLSVRYKDFTATNNKKLIIKPTFRDSNYAIDFRQFAINGFDQRLTVAGVYSTIDTSNVRISASNIDLSTYMKLYFSDIDTNNMLKGKIRYVDLTYRGKIENPRLELLATSEILRLGQTKIGRLDAIVKYANDNITPDITFSNEGNSGRFKLIGNIPFVNPLDSKIDSLERLKRIEGKLVSLNAIAENFQLKVFQQLLPYTSGFSGILDGNISLHGTPEKPELKGKMDVSKGQFLVTITQMAYDFDASLSTENEKLLIDNARVFVSDEPSRFISGAGYIDFTNLNLNDINLIVSGDVKAFDKDNGMTELGIEGDLWVGSGKNKLKIRGNSSRIDLTGNLVLVKGNVSFNPFRQEAYNIYSDDFTYGVIIDSVKNRNDSIRKVLTEINDSTIILTKQVMNPFEKIMYVSENKDYRIVAKEKPGSFFYNVVVTTSGNVFLKFIVNERTQQEFFGEIMTDNLNIYNDEKNNMLGRGTITLGDSYYKFFRKFNASGKVDFLGPITNPQLNITAVYKGYAAVRVSGITQNLEDVEITMKVTGNAKDPKLNISLNRNGLIETGANAESDALSFLLFGKFKDQLSFSESTNFGASLGASYLSGYISSSLENILPFIVNTDVNYIDSQSGTVAQNTDIRFTATVGDAVVKFGGQIFKGIANTDLVVDYPLTKLFGSTATSSNVILRLERIYDPFVSQNNLVSTEGTRYGAVVYYRIKF